MKAPGGLPPRPDQDGQSRGDVIRVLVCANSPVELAGLEALVTSPPQDRGATLELAGSCLGKAMLIQRLSETDPDVLTLVVFIVAPSRLSGPRAGADADYVD